jgi:hypothetical protein
LCVSACLQGWISNANTGFGISVTIAVDRDVTTVNWDDKK